MIFGGLSEKEVEKVSSILKADNIPFTVEKDQEIEAFNKTSIKNDLRHYTPPNISTHILAINIADEDFSKITEQGRNKLLDLGITDQAPAPEDFVPQTGEGIHQKLAEGPRRLVAFNFKHQLIAGGLLLTMYLYFEYFQKV